MNSNDETEKDVPLEGPGWTAYRPIPEDWTEEDLKKLGYRYEFHFNLRRWLKGKILRKIYNHMFSELSEENPTKYYDIGIGNYSPDSSQYLYRARAEYLISHHWIQMRFGSMTAEYSIINNVGYFYYSQNDGIEFSFNFEIELEDDVEARIESLMGMFAYAEGWMHQAIKEGQALSLRSEYC
ncbi:MAG: hypothetical protein WCO08_04250 [Actinomycetes bacterium]